MKCPFGKTIRSTADITCGDAIGLKEIGKEVDSDDNRGLSLVIVNTDAGKQMIDEVKDGFLTFPIKQNEVNGIELYNRGIRLP